MTKATTPVMAIDTTSPVKVTKATSLVMVIDTTSPVRVTKATSLVMAIDTTSPVRVTKATSLVMVIDTTSPVRVTKATSPVRVTNTKSPVRVTDTDLHIVVEPVEAQSVTSVIKTKSIMDMPDEAENEDQICSIEQNFKVMFNLVPRAFCFPHVEAKCPGYEVGLCYNRKRN